MTKQYECIGPLVRAGIEYEDALALRRIEMTLRRWFEAERGSYNAYASFTIERDEPDSPPYRVCRLYDGRVIRSRTPDRETGARRRLAKIMAKYPGFGYYVQTDPRGCALYIMRPGDVGAGDDVSCVYTRGLPVFK